MCLAVYSDCLAGFREPLSSPDRGHTGLKNVYRDHKLQALVYDILSSTTAVFSYARGKERHTQRETETEREKHRERDIETERNREGKRETDTQTHRHTESERDRQTDREKQRQTERQTERQIDRLTDR